MPEGQQLWETIVSNKPRNERENGQGWELELRLRISNIPVRTGEDREVSEGTEIVPSQAEMTGQFPATQKALS